jgi:hypothetical protein
VTSAAIVELDGEAEPAPGRERRRAMVLVFAMCVAVGGASVGRDGPLATAPIDPAHVLALPPRINDAQLFTMPDRLANEPLSNLEFVALPVRGTQGLGARVGNPGGVWLVTWTEDGTAYWLSSERRELRDLVNLADSLR